MKTLAKLYPGVNPVLVKEIRSRMRGPRAFLILTISLLLLALVSYLLYILTANTPYGSGIPMTTQIGQTLFTALVFMELILICSVTPAITAGAISGEKERQTYEMLLATPLHPARLLWGKLVSALSYIFLLIFAAVPLASLIFTFGGVTLRDMIKALAVLGTLAVLVGSLGLFFSALTSRTGRATVFSYVTVMGMVFAPPFLSSMIGMFRQIEAPRWVLVPSPLSALFSAIASTSSGGGTVFGMLGWGYWGAVQPAWSDVGIPRPVYHYSIPLYLLVALILYLITSRLVLPMRRWRLSWKEILVGALLILAVVGVSAGAFWFTADRYENVISPSSVEVPAVMSVPVINSVNVDITIEKEAPTPTPLILGITEGPVNVDVTRTPWVKGTEDAKGGG